MSDTIKIILAGIIGMLSLASAIVMFALMYQRKVIAHQQELKTINEQKEKELTKAAIQAEEEERGRIAAELHDDVGAMLASVRLYMNLAAKQSGESEAFSQSRTLIDDTIDKVRSMSRSLQPTMLQHLGLQKTLQAFFSLFNGSKVIFIQYSGEDLPSVSESIGLSIYRIMQELVNNTLKHAYATNIWVHQTVLDSILQFRFSHDGKGIRRQDFQEYIYKKDTTGLKNIINRLKILNGSICFTNEGNVYSAVITIPL